MEELFETDVVVVGAGVIGCSAAVHLQDAGVGEVAVLERDDVAQGTSRAGAGFVGEWAAGWDPHLGAEELAIERYGLACYAALSADGHELSYRPNGNLYFAVSAAGWERWCAPLLDAVEDARRLSPAEVAEATGGVVAAEHVYAGVLHPSGGQVSAPAAAHAFAARLRERGGRLETRTPVRRILVEDGRVRGVETDRGRIAARHVVLAAGAWVNALLRPLGAELPIAPLVAMRVVTEPLDVPATMPTLMSGELRMYAREERGGLLWASAFAGAPRRAFVDGDPPERFEPLPLDGYEEMSEGIRASFHAIPRLAAAQSATVSYGVPTYTADGRALVGEVPGIAGLVVVSGCNEGGVTHAPGFGRLVAELIAEGTTSLCSLDPFALDRFGDRFPTARAVAEAMA